MESGHPFLRFFVTLHLVNMEQGEKSGDDFKVWASLSRRETQVDAIEVKLSAMMEARPRKCGEGNAELSRILCGTVKVQATTTIARHYKKNIMKRLDKLIDIIEDKTEEATAYRNRKDRQGNLRKNGQES